MPLAQPPSPPSSPPGEPPAEMHKNRFPVVWKGAVNLKSQSVRVRLHELDGMWNVSRKKIVLLT